MEIVRGKREAQGIRRTRTTSREVPSPICKMAPACRASGKAGRKTYICRLETEKKDQEDCLLEEDAKEMSEAKDGIGNGRDTGINTGILTGINGILEAALLESDTGTIENCLGKRMKIIPNRSYLFRFIPKSVSAPIRTHSSLPEKIFESRLT